MSLPAQTDPIRLETVARASTVVIKVGTNVLADSTGQLDRHRIQSLADQLHRVRSGGRKVVLVTSGAIGAGVGKLGLGKRPTDLPQLQACAAVGQSALMQLYQESLAPHGVHTAQILLTAGDFDSRARYLNVRNTIRTLFEYDALPIINENDTVAVAEIKFGDNDHLAAMVTNLLRAPLLVLLTNVDGLYSDDPRSNPDAKLVATVPNIDKSVTELAASTQKRSRHRRDEEQAACGPARDRRRRIGHHGERLARRHPRPRVRGRAGGNAVSSARGRCSGVEAVGRLHRPAQGDAAD